MVPGAIGSQTNGSVIRPAAFCGVVGFKPTHGLIPRSGALLLSRALDHVGVFARTVADAALLAETLAGFDEEDPDTRPDRAPAACRRGGERAAIAAALRLRSLAGLEARRAGDSGRRSRSWSRRSARRSTRSSSARASSAPSSCTASSWRSRWPTTCIATSRRARDKLSPVLRALIERGRACPGDRLHAGRGRQRAAQRGARRDLRRVRRDPDAGGARARRRAASTARATRRSAPPGPISARRP